MDSIVNYIYKIEVNKGIHQIDHRLDDIMDSLSTLQRSFSCINLFPFCFVVKSPKSFSNGPWTIKQTRQYDGNNARFKCVLGNADRNYVDFVSPPLVLPSNSSSIAIRLPFSDYSIHLSFYRHGLPYPI